MDPQGKKVVVVGGAASVAIVGAFAVFGATNEPPSSSSTPAVAPQTAGQARAEVARSGAFDLLSREVAPGETIETGANIPSDWKPGKAAILTGAAIDRFEVASFACTPSEGDPAALWCALKAKNTSDKPARLSALITYDVAP